MAVFGAADVEILLDQSADHLHDPFFLVAALEQQPAHAIDRLPLLVVDVVVFEQVFAGFEVLRFDGFLRLLNALGDELRLDGHILFHAQPQHQALHALAAEDAHQIVLQGKIEAGTATAAGGDSTLAICSCCSFSVTSKHSTAPSWLRAAMTETSGAKGTKP